MAIKYYIVDKVTGWILPVYKPQANHDTSQIISVDMVKRLRGEERISNMRRWL